jgi:hypothetical protein
MRYGQDTTDGTERRPEVGALRKNRLSPHQNINLGAAVGPFGLLSMTVDEARQTAETLPEMLARQIRFVGMNVDVVRQLRDNSAREPRSRGKCPTGRSIGPDDLLFAPVERIVLKPVTI